MLIVPSLLFVIGCDDKHKTTTQTKQKPKHTQKNDFNLTDVDHRSTTLHFRENRILVQRVIQPVILIHIFSTQTQLTRSMLPYLSQLQKKYKSSLFVIGIVVPEHISDTRLREYMVANQTTFFISNHADNMSLAHRFAAALHIDRDISLPLTIIYDQGRYMTHFQGVTPIEMIIYQLSTIKHLTKRREQ